MHTASLDLDGGKDSGYVWMPVPVELESHTQPADLPSLPRRLTRRGCPFGLYGSSSDLNIRSNLLGAGGTFLNGSRPFSIAITRCPMIENEGPECC
jgi:hypothetical protein